MQPALRICANKRLIHRSKQYLYSIISPARAPNAAGISKPRAIETANVKRTPGAALKRRHFISADIEMNRCSYPDPALRIRRAIYAEASKLNARLFVLGQFLGKQRQ
jgi:hypothetical protein